MLLIAALLVPFAWIMRKILPDRQPWLTKPFHRLVCWACGITVKSHGRRARGTVLYLANHISWADIPTLGCLIRARFVAKSEMSDDPFLDFFCDLQRTIYVERGDRRSAVRQAGEITAALRSGDSLILFPEGTTSDLRRPLPFKSSLLVGLAESGLRDVRIQPVSIAYTRVRSMPVFRGRFPQVAWLGHFGIADSVRQFLRLRAVRVDVTFHESLDPEAFEDRKHLTRAVADEIARGYRQAMRDYVRPA
nr:lysophospholipid acyltransferase family protein [Pacificimonas pallii]